MKVARVLVAVVVATALAGPAHAAHEISMSQYSGFNPSVVRHRAGATVTWEKTSGFHNVSSRQGMFRSGSPSSEPFTFSRTFSAGRYPYICEVHPQTMTGVVRVKPRLAARPAGRAFTVRWATAATNTGSSFTVRYRVNDGRWRRWFAATTADAAVFGRNRNPVRVVPGRTYSFRVRSRSGDNASSFSPRVTFRP